MNTVPELSREFQHSVPVFFTPENSAPLRDPKIPKAGRAQRRYVAEHWDHLEDRIEIIVGRLTPLNWLALQLIQTLSESLTVLSRLLIQGVAENHK